jgi:hypothetical protein
VRFFRHQTSDTDVKNFSVTHTAPTLVNYRLSLSIKTLRKAPSILIGGQVVRRQPSSPATGALAVTK